jgi:H+-transporting ATPase
VFVARTRGRFWTTRPAPVLLLAVIGTQITATFIAVYGFLMTPLGWTYAGITWAYCLVMFLIQDQVKVVARKIFCEEHSGYFGRHLRGGGVC